MDFSYTRSGNVIAKTAQVQGAQFVVNQGLSYIGRETQVHGERNNGKPVISWGQYCVLDDGCVVSPAQRNNVFYPMIIGRNVYFGPNSKIEAASVGSHVIVGKNAHIGEFAVLRDCAVVPANAKVPPYTVVGPMAVFGGGELPDSAEEVIHRFCKMKLDGIKADAPFIESELIT